MMFRLTSRNSTESEFQPAGTLSHQLNFTGVPADEAHTMPYGSSLSLAMTSAESAQYSIGDTVEVTIVK